MNIYTDNVLVQWNVSIYFFGSFVNISARETKKRENMINVFAVIIWFTLLFSLNEMLFLDYYWNVTWIMSRFLSERAKIISK